MERAPLSGDRSAAKVATTAGTRSTSLLRPGPPKRLRRRISKLVQRDAPRLDYPTEQRPDPGGSRNSYCEPRLPRDHRGITA